MNKQVVNKNPTTLVRIDTGWHKLLQDEAKRANRTIREVLEGYLAIGYRVERSKK